MNLLFAHTKTTLLFSCNLEKETRGGGQTSSSPSPFKIKLGIGYTPPPHSCSLSGSKPETTSCNFLKELLPLQGRVYSDSLPFSTFLRDFLIKGKSIHNFTIICTLNIPIGTSISHWETERVSSFHILPIVNS